MATILKNELTKTNLCRRDANRLKHYLSYVADREVNARTLCEYLLERKNSGISSKTLKADKYAIFSALRRYLAIDPSLRSLIFEIFDIVNLSVKLQKTKSKMRQSDLITLEDLKRIKIAHSQKDFCALEFLYVTGLRSFEFCNILKSDCRVVGDLVEIQIRGKNERVRFVVIPKQLFDLIGYFWEGQEYLFAQNNGKKFSGQRLIRLFNRFSKTLGRRIYPYLCRHSFACFALKESNDVKAVANYLGNSPQTLLDSYIHTELDLNVLGKRFEALV